MGFCELTLNIEGLRKYLFISHRPKSLLAILKNILELKQWTNRKQEFSQWTNWKQRGKQFVGNANNDNSSEMFFENSNASRDSYF
jgi:hypothetical protein